MMARLATEEEKARVAIGLMEFAKKEVAEAVPKFKALVEFIEEVRERVVDFYIKGFTCCKQKVAEGHPDWDMEIVV